MQTSELSTIKSFNR